MVLDEALDEVLLHAHPLAGAAVACASLIPIMVGVDVRENIDVLAKNAPTPKSVNKNTMKYFLRAVIASSNIPIQSYFLFFCKYILSFFLFSGICHCCVKYPYDFMQIFFPSRYMNVTDM